MLLKTFIKVGHITNLSDARYCAGMGVDLLGFCFDPKNEDYLPSKSISEIMGWIAGPKYVADFGNLSYSEIETIKADLSLDYTLVSDQATATILLDQENLVILNIQINTAKDLDMLASTLDPALSFLMVSCENALLFDQITAKLQTLHSPIPMLKNYDNTVENILDTASNDLFHGIILQGSQEDQPGFKDYEELADILELLQED